MKGDRSTASAERVIRGGSWNTNARNVRAAYRNRNHPSNRNDNLGFRCRAHEGRGCALPEQTGLLSVARDGKEEMAAGALVVVSGCGRERSPAGRFLSAVPCH